MSVNVQPDRYAWPAATEGDITITCSRIARHLSRAKAGVIGLLPVAGPLAAPAPLGPFLSRLALALVDFVAGDVALVDAWTTWPAGPPHLPEDDGREDAEKKARAPGSSRFREIHPRVLEVSPPPCDDAASAAVALQNTVAVLRRGVSVALVHLGGYAPAGTAPASLILADGVVMMVPPRQARRREVMGLLEHIAPAKRLGAILIG
jgi:hypothetical protein